MKTNIFRPIQFGKETFHPHSYDSTSFKMHYKLEKGGKVPTHVHEYMDEYFSVLKGEMQFIVNGVKILKKQGEEIMVPKGIPHSISNSGSDPVEMFVQYKPCADTHRMFEIIATFDESKPGRMINMLKYFYLYPRLGLKPFSAIKPAFMMPIISGITAVIGKISGWDRLIKTFQ